jgi:hypothetical protein
LAAQLADNLADIRARAEQRRDAFHEFAADRERTIFLDKLARDGFDHRSARCELTFEKLRDIALGQRERRYSFGQFRRAIAARAFNPRFDKLDMRAS